MADADLGAGAAGAVTGVLMQQLDRVAERPRGQLRLTSDAPSSTRLETESGSSAVAVATCCVRAARAMLVDLAA